MTEGKLDEERRQGELISVNVRSIDEVKICLKKHLEHLQTDKGPDRKCTAEREDFQDYIMLLKLLIMTKHSD